MPIQKEVQKAIFDLNYEKSPGDDGLTSEFYKTVNKVLLLILTELYNTIYLSKNMCKTMKQGIITLMYKNKGTPYNLKY